ncbi:MAG: translocation/assembly module TamB domain-containing protein [Gemmatimonadota bacterium]
MRRAFKIILGIVGTVVVLAVVAVFTLTNTDWGREQVRQRVVSALNGSAHGIVRVGRISGNMLRGLSLHDVAIADSAGAPFIALDSVRAGYGLRSLIGRKIELSDVALYRPVIVLDRQPGGLWNYERIFPGDTSTVEKDTTGVQFGDWLVFKDVRIAQGQITIRTPWQPDSALANTARDSAITVALNGDSRTTIKRVNNGFQQVQEFQRIDAKMPLLRIAHPEHPTRRIEIDSLRMLALAFAPPAADIRQLAGVVELDSDSVWFRQTTLALPASRASLDGRYSLESGDMSMRIAAEQLALNDVRFLYPELPEDGTASFGLALDWMNGTQRYIVDDLQLQTEGARASGDVGLTLGDTLHLHQTDVTFDGIDTRLIERLVPGLDVPRQGVLSGRAKVDGTLAAMQVDGDVTFNDRRSGRSRVITAGQIGSDDGVIRATGLRVTLSPLQVDLARIASPSLPIGGTVTGSATLNGASNTRLYARGIDLTHLDRGERSRFTGQGAVRLGDVPFLDVNLQARPLSLVTVGRFAPSAGLRGSVTGPVRVLGTFRDLAINSTLATSEGGVISATGRLDLASKEIGYNMEVATTLFNANALVEKAPTTSLSAQLSASGRGFDPATMTSNISADVSTSTIDTVAVDSSKIRVRIASGMMNIDTLGVRAPGAAVDVTGTFGMSKALRGSLEYQLTVDSLGKFARYLPRDTGAVFPRPERTAERLARERADSARTAQRLAVARAAGAAPPASPVVVDTPPALRRDSLAGAIRARGTLTGGLGGFDTKGEATATGIVAQGSAVQRARATWEWLGALTPEAALSVTANADSVSAAGFALDSVEARGTYRKPGEEAGGTARVAVFQNSNRDYAIRADYSISTERNEARFNEMRMRFDSTRWASTGPGAVRWGQPGIEIDSIDLRNSANGRVFLDGRLPTEGAANLRMIIENFQVGDLLGLLQSDVQARGLLSINTNLEGTTAAPTIRGAAGIAEAQYQGTVVPDVRTTFDYADVKLTARADATYVGRQLLTANAAVPLNLALKGVTGSRLPDEPASIDVLADSVPLELASRFTDAISQIQGYAEGTAKIRGTLRKPDVQGDVIMALGQARVNALGVTMRNVTGSIRMRGDTVIVDSVTANSGGRISITGGVGIAKIAEPSFDLRLTANGARVLDNEQGRVRADANITMQGPFLAVEVGGRARIREGVIYIPESDNRQSLNAGDPAVFAVIDTTDVTARELVPGQSPFVNNLRMNLGLVVDRDTWVRSTEANVEIYTEDPLRINIDRRKQTIVLDGIVNTDRGEYEFLSKRFEIKRGTARFVGTQELDPLLQITGEYEVQQQGSQALAIRILIGGTLLAPRLVLESDAQPPISQSDLLSYLAFGSQSGSLLQFGGSGLAGGSPGGGLVGTTAKLATRQLAGVAVGEVFRNVEGQLSRSLGADVLHITPANVPTELAGGAYGLVTEFFKSTQFEYGKYFNTNTYLGVQAQGQPIPGFRVEHRLRQNPGISIESSFQPRFFIREPTLGTPALRTDNSFGLFLVRRWRF